MLIGALHANKMTNFKISLGLKWTWVSTLPKAFWNVPITTHATTGYVGKICELLQNTPQFLSTSSFTKLCLDFYNASRAANLTLPSVSDFAHGTVSSWVSEPNTTPPPVISSKVSFKGSVEMEHSVPLWSAEAFESFSEEGCCKGC